MSLNTINALITGYKNGVEVGIIPYVGETAVVSTVSFTAQNWEQDNNDQLYKMTLGTYKGVVHVLNNDGLECPLVDVLVDSSTGYITLQTLSAFAGKVVYLN